MNRREISANLDAFLRLQALCLLIIAAVSGIFWAMERPGGLTDISIYVFLQVNLTTLALKPLRFLYGDWRSKYRWPIHLGLVLAITAVVVVIATAVVYRVDGSHGPFSVYLRPAWKFPFVANVVFSIGYEAYKVATCRLKRHNQQLQQKIDAETAERQQEAEELKQALDIQRGLLPKEIPQLPPFEITGAWEPARIVGGDYYDVIRIAKNKLAICIADVAGKGVSAALLMANVQAAVRAFASEYMLPSQVCAQINSVLFTNTAPEKFVTLFYGVLDARARTLQYANAGHLRPLLIRSSGEKAHLENGGALLGVFASWSYEDAVIELEPGDLLLLFTDGITEAMAPDGEEFGEERMLAAVQSAEKRPVSELREQLLSNVKQFSNSRLSDDATLIMVSASAALTGSEPTSLNRNHTEEPASQLAGVRS